MAVARPAPSPSPSDTASRAEAAGASYAVGADAAATPALATGSVRPVRDAVLAATVVFLVSACGLGVTTLFARAEQLQEVRNELLEVALIAATRIDGDVHQRIRRPEDEGGLDYRAVVTPLAGVQYAAADVRSLYTAVLRDGAVRFVVDTDALARAPDHVTAHVHVMDEYTGPDRDFFRALSTGAPLVNAAPTTDPDGTYMSAYAPFRDGSGRVVGVVGADMDVRDYEARVARVTRITSVSLISVAALSMITGLAVLRLRRASAAAKERTRILFQALASARTAAEQSVRAKSTFVAMMSHELRTPLTAIIGYAELMHETLVASGRDALARDVVHVQTAGRHLTAIISDILDYSKLEAERLVLTPAAIELDAAFAEVEHAVRAEADAKGLDLRFSARAKRVVADPGRLQQVLRNVVGNAVKFTDRGRVTVRARRVAGTPARVAITVHDTGVGIPTEKRRLLFQPFSQIDGSLTRRVGGTGLGLVLSLKLVQAMAGTLRVRSREGRGSNVRIVFPGDPHHATEVAA